MTIIIVGILHGRTQQEWYDWIADRVEKKVGFDTPKELPTIYSPVRVAAAKQRWASNASRESSGPGGFGNASGGTFTRAGASGFGALARVFGSNITFHPSGGISGSGNNLMFEHDDSSDEYESGEEGDHSGSGTNGSRAPQKDLNKSLRAQLEELKEDDKMDDEDEKMTGNHAPGRAWTIDDDGDSPMTDGSAGPTAPLAKSAIWSRRITKSGQPTEAGDDSDEEEGKEKIPIGLSSAPPTSIGSPLIPSPSSISTTSGDKANPQGEAPPPPKANGIASAPANVEQLKKTPGGDAPSDAVKADGLMDKSEDPVVVAN